MRILVTGGAGYIGSTICSALEDADHVPVVLDSLIGGGRRPERRHFYQGDVGDSYVLERIFDQHPDIEAIIHCAALTSVPGSVEKPYQYYLHNVVASLRLFHNLQAHGCYRVVFSSSASVYNAVEADVFEVWEEEILNPQSPYARTKVQVEMILTDLCAAGPLRAISLRYFNPLGADPKMRSGPQDNQVLGKLIDADAKGGVFQVTGTDWPTRDGTGIRDYIHVWDLAQAHVKAVESFETALGGRNHRIINVGAGRGVTVRELVNAFETVVGHQIRTEDVPPRPGDVAGAFANVDLAWTLMEWESRSTLKEAIASAIRWKNLGRE